ncbi:MAG: FAD-binding oxidoreductase, partial [Limisphaerales bacterium]
MKNDWKKSLGQLQKLLPHGELHLDAPTLQKNSGDKWFASCLPDAVALPGTTESVSRILAWANQNKIPVTSRGAGFGYVGGCV